MNLKEIQKKYPIESNIARCKDISKQKFGKLTPLYIVNRELWFQYGKRKRTTWVCKCECGNICLVRSHDLIGKRIKSCGCLQKQYRKEMGKKMGRDDQQHSRHPVASSVWLPPLLSLFPEFSCLIAWIHPSYLITVE